MDISVRKRGDVQMVQLRGDLRLGAPVNQLRELLEELLAAGETRAVLKLDEVAMIDSSGIGLLVKYLARTRERGGGLKLVHPSDFAVKTLRAVGVLNLFEIYDNEDSAAASFTLASAS
jgi:anti-sigma B factor antagonist